MPDVNIPFWSWSIIVFWLSNFLTKNHFWFFFRLGSPRTRFFKVFKKYTISMKKMWFFRKNQKMRDSLGLSSIFLLEMIIYVYTRKLMHTECLYLKYSARKKIRNSDCWPSSASSGVSIFIHECALKKFHRKCESDWKKSVLPKRCRIQFCTLDTCLGPLYDD